MLMVDVSSILRYVFCSVLESLFSISSVLDSCVSPSVVAISSVVVSKFLVTRDVESVGTLSVTTNIPSARLLLKSENKFKQ